MNYSRQLALAVLDNNNKPIFLRGIGKRSIGDYPKDFWLAHSVEIVEAAFEVVWKACA